MPRAATGVVALEEAETYIRRELRTCPTVQPAKERMARAEDIMSEEAEAAFALAVAEGPREAELIPRRLFGEKAAATQPVRPGTPLSLPNIPLRRPAAGWDLPVYAPRTVPEVSQTPELIATNSRPVQRHC